MAKKKKSKKKQSKTDKIVSMKPEQFAKMKGKSGLEKLRRMYTTLKSMYTRRTNQIKKAGLVSHAQLAYERDDTPSSKKTANTLTRNQLILEILRYQDFFKAKTSTIEGIQGVNKEQDQRIFEAEGGKTPRNMTEEERELFWDLYDEFKNKYADWREKLSSDEIQKKIASRMFSPRRKKSPLEDLPRFLRETRNQLMKRKEKELLEERPNVFSGDWDTIIQ